MKKFIATLCSVLTVLCVSFAFSGCFDDDDKNTTDYDQYFVNDCPIGLSDNSSGVGTSKLSLNFTNNSDSKIIAYEFIYIVYDVYDKPLIYLGDTDKYSKFAYTPINFVPNSGDYHSYSINSQVYYAEVYVYYALFEDRTTWGCRENISNEKIVEYATMYKVERYSY